MRDHGDILFTYKQFIEKNDSKIKHMHIFILHFIAFNLYNIKTFNLNQNSF